LKNIIYGINNFISNPDGFRILSNNIFFTKELERFKEFFDVVESNPLTVSQRKAIITHEDNTRVIAGAGSGKTSVIVAKVGYLLKKGLYDSNEILLIAFNRAAASEIEERIKNRINVNVKVTTFHALGLGIISKVEKRKPSLAKFAENEMALNQYIQEILVELVKDKNTTELITTYFQSFFAPYKSKFEFNELGDYYKYIKDNDLISLEGGLLKSFEEVEIANFLTLNGIKYKYESPYSKSTATISHRQYEPDFYLTEYDIYIEHFGIKRDGSTAPFINREQYLAGMEWNGKEIYIEITKLY
jgi:DNA helicase-4